MSHTSLSSAHSSLRRKLNSLANESGRQDYEYRKPHTFISPEAALLLCNDLDERACALVTGIALLRHEAETAIQARKGEAA